MKKNIAVRDAALSMSNTKKNLIFKKKEKL